MFGYMEACYAKTAGRIWMEFATKVDRWWPGISDYLLSYDIKNIFITVLISTDLDGILVELLVIQ